MDWLYCEFNFNYYSYKLCNKFCRKSSNLILTKNKRYDIIYIEKGKREDTK